MKCHFCNSDTKQYKRECPFCKGKGCGLCNETGFVTVVQCTNENCTPPDHNLEPWDDEI